jgi:high-affinity iron transporter
MPLKNGQSSAHLGVSDAVRYTERLERPAAGLPQQLSLQQLVDMSGGRIPVGFVAGQTDGPFKADWTRSGSRQLWLVDGQVLDYRQTDATAVTLTGGGLASSRTLAVTGTAPGDVEVGGGALSAASTSVQTAETAAGAQSVTQIDRHFWGRTFPIVLVVLVLVLIAWTARATRALGDPLLRKTSVGRIDAQ